MKPYEIDFAKVLIRFYLMMAVIIVAGFTHQWWLASVGFLIFLATMLGVAFKKDKQKQGAKMANLPGQQGLRKAA
ncbi:MAG: hypothetical protein AAB316_07650 [Bacteroidota bacterium]